MATSQFNGWSPLFGSGNSGGPMLTRSTEAYVSRGVLRRDKKTSDPPPRHLRPQCQQDPPARKGQSEVDNAGYRGPGRRKSALRQVRPNSQEICGVDGPWSPPTTCLIAAGTFSKNPVRRLRGRLKRTGHPIRHLHQTPSERQTSRCNAHGWGHVVAKPHRTSYPAYISSLPANWARKNELNKIEDDQ
ncbi:hypothetical protein VUR80DRAFT_3468 [Thermomyces stellatus]